MCSYSYLSVLLIGTSVMLTGCKCILPTRAGSVQRVPYDGFEAADKFVVRYDQGKTRRRRDIALPTRTRPEFGMINAESRYSARIIKPSARRGCIAIILPEYFYTIDFECELCDGEIICAVLQKSNHGYVTGLLNGGWLKIV
jgi:hypothetical protein